MWRAWNAALREDYGIHTAGGRLVTSGQVTDCGGDVRGGSMVEFESLDAAIQVAQRSPDLAFGGSVELLEEFVVTAQPGRRTGRKEINGGNAEAEPTARNRRDVSLVRSLEQRADELALEDEEHDQ